MSSVGGKSNTGQSEDTEVIFRCELCGIREVCHYYGRSPDFVKNKVKFKEDTYVMRDPFVQNSKGFLAVGGRCGVCSIDVCMDCSTFYTKRICDSCAGLHLTEFPADIGNKIQKKLESRT